MQGFRFLIYRILNGLFILYNIRIREKFITYGEHRIKYIFSPNKSKKLVVVFSGFHPKSARYNYMLSLKKYKYNKLFILDDFGANGTGSYYLDCVDNSQIEKAIIDLIKRIKEQHNIDELFFVGSSKGGYAAINFSLNFPDSTVIAGAPQYYIGSYMKVREYNVANKFILGENYTDEALVQLDNRLKQKIENSPNKPIIYLHYSDSEHTFSEHIKDLISDLENVGISVIKDIDHYKTHAGVAKAFPPFLQKTLNNLS